MKIFIVFKYYEYLHNNNNNYFYYNNNYYLVFK